MSNHLTNRGIPYVERYSGAANRKCTVCGKPAHFRIQTEDGQAFACSKQTCLLIVKAAYSSPEPDDDDGPLEIDLAALRQSGMTVEDLPFAAVGVETFTPEPYIKPTDRVFDQIKRPNVGALRAPLEHFTVAGTSRPLTPRRLRQAGYGFNRRW